MSIMRFAVLVALALCLASPRAVLAQRSGSGRAGGGHATRAPRGDGGSGQHAKPADGSVQPDPGGRETRIRGSATGRRGVEPAVWPWLWWPYPAFDIPVDANDADRDIVAIPVPPPPIEKVAEPSLIQPLLPSQPPQLSGQSPRGSLRLEVRPETAQVYVDGFYGGTVEDSNRSPSGLNLTAGWHRLEFRAPGYETPAVNVTVLANQATSYRGELKAIGR